MPAIAARQRHDTHGLDGDRPDDWRDAAACIGEDPELWWPLAYSAGTIRQVHTAQRICRSCPVQPECLAHAVTTPEVDGIWGGTTPAERGVTDHKRQPTGYVPPLKVGVRLPLGTLPAMVYPQRKCVACGKRVRTDKLRDHRSPDGRRCHGRTDSTGEDNA